MLDVAMQRAKDGELRVVGCWLRVDRGTTLRVVGFLLAEMRKQPGGSEQDVAMQRAKDGELRVVG